MAISGNVTSRGSVSRGAATRGVTTPSPMGWFTPEPAERLAAFAKSMGWHTKASWGEDRGKTFTLELGRMLLEGENKAAKGDRWWYRIVWEEVPEEERSSNHVTRMRIRACRALTPTKGEWENGPSLKLITDLVSRHPMPVRKIDTRTKPVSLVANAARIG